MDRMYRFRSVQDRESFFEVLFLVLKLKDVIEGYKIIILRNFFLIYFILIDFINIYKLLTNQWVISQRSVHCSYL